MSEEITNTQDTTSTETTTTKTKTTTLKIHEVESDAFIVNVNGWRIRVHFAGTIKKSVKEGLRFGQEVKVSYEGNLDDVHSLKFKKFK